VIDIAEKLYRKPYAVSRADFTCGDVLLVLLFDLIDQTLACLLPNKADCSKTPTVMVDEADWDFGDNESWSPSNGTSPPPESGAHTLH